MKVLAITVNTFREAVRDKVLYSLIFFAMIMIGLGSMIDRITIGQTAKIIKDFGLSSISLFGVMIAIFMGVSLVFKEIDKRTIFTIVSKPIFRSQFLLGKYFGLLLTLLVEIAIMTVGLYGFLFLFSQGGLDFGLLKAVILIFCELSLVTAIAILFSSFSTPFLSGMFALAIFVIGHLTDDLLEFSVRFDETGRFLAKSIYYVLPNLELFNIKGPVVHQQPIAIGEMVWASGYAAAYIAFLLLAAMLIFQKRDFK